MRAIAVEDRVDHLLTVDRVFQRQPHVDVIEGRRPRVHREAVMLGAGDGEHVDPRRAFQQRNGVQVDRVDVVDLARDQRVLTRRVVEDQDLLDGVEIGQALFPVAVVAGVVGAHAELDIVHPERAAAVGGVGVDRAVGLRG
jgi:hypothetical protein